MNSASSAASGAYSSPSSPSVSSSDDYGSPIGSPISSTGDSSPSGSGSAASGSYSSPPQEASDDYGSPIGSPISTAGDTSLSGSGSTASGSYSSPPQQSSDDYGSPSGGIISADSGSTVSGSVSSGSVISSGSATDDYGSPSGAILDSGSLESGTGQASSVIGNGPFDSPFEPSPRIAEESSDSYGSPVSQPKASSPSTSSYSSPLPPPPYSGPSINIEVASPIDTSANDDYSIPSSPVLNTGDQSSLVIDLSGSSDSSLVSASDSYGVSSGGFSQSAPAGGTIDSYGSSIEPASVSNSVPKVSEVVDIRVEAQAASDDYGLPNAPPLGLPSYSSSNRISEVRQKRRWFY